MCSALILRSLVFSDFIIVRVSSFFFVFFFKQNTAYEMRISDWSSDVCSSDLADVAAKAVADSAQADVVSSELAMVTAGDAAPAVFAAAQDDASSDRKSAV